MRLCGRVHISLDWQLLQPPLSFIAPVRAGQTMVSLFEYQLRGFGQIVFCSGRSKLSKLTLEVSKSQSLPFLSPLALFWFTCSPDGPTSQVQKSFFWPWCGTSRNVGAKCFCILSLFITETLNNTSTAVSEWQGSAKEAGYAGLCIYQLLNSTFFQLSDFTSCCSDFRVFIWLLPVRMTFFRFFLTPHELTMTAPSHSSMWHYQTSHHISI